jgi:DNA-binding PadR family transcriptional regulator
MNKTTATPETYLPLTPAVFNILLALVDGEKHGYAIMLEVENNTNGQVKMGPGTLYGSIKRMLANDLISESDERPDPALDDQRRRYYRLTGMGERVLKMEAQRLADQMVPVYAKGVLAVPFKEMPA